MRRLMVLLVALVAFGALGGFVAGAVTRPPVPAAVSRGSLAEIAVVRSDRQSPVDVASPVAVSSADLVLSVAKGKQDLFDVRFSGVVLFPQGATVPVVIDVTVDGIAMPPSGLPAWPNASASTTPFQLERAIGPLPEGTYHIGIVIEAANANDHRPVQLLGWTLVSQRTSEHAKHEGTAV